MSTSPAPLSSTVVRRRGIHLALAGPAIFALLAPTPAFAYLDPSTGSMVVSAIVGIFASIALAVKTYWYKIKAFLRRGDKSGTKERPASRESTD